MVLELKAVKIEKPAEVNLILGQTHFIKSVEDIYEVMVAASAAATERVSSPPMATSASMPCEAMVAMTWSMPSFPDMRPRSSS